MAPKPQRGLSIKGYHGKKCTQYSEFINSSKHPVAYNGKLYPTCEHLFLSFKFARYRPDIAEIIRVSGSVDSARLEAQSYESDARPDWVTVSPVMMEVALYYKFTQHDDLRQQLVNTGDDQLVEDRGAGILAQGLMELRRQFLVTNSPPRPTPPRARILLNHMQYYAGFNNSSPHAVYYNQKNYTTTEHLFQSFKFPHNTEVLEQISVSPQLEDTLRRCALHTRNHWDHLKIGFMELALTYKFEQHADLRRKLRATGNTELIANDADSFWGTGADGNGHNEFGKALMTVRAKLPPEPQRQEEKNGCCVIM